MTVKGLYRGGRPVKHPIKPRGNCVWNTPLSGYVTPRLKPEPRGNEFVHAVGFTAEICSEEVGGE